jgi:hypothetical protein
MKSLRIALVASACLVAATASAQPGQVGAQATSGQPLPRTPWGDPDLRGTWPLQNINDARIRLERPTEFGTRERLTDEEFAARVQAAEQSDAHFSVELGGGGTVGLAGWLRSSAMGRRSSLLIEPIDGRLPPLTEAAKELYAKGRSTLLRQLPCRVGGGDAGYR